MVEGFDSHSQGVGEAFGLAGDNHELLEIHIVPSVHTAIEYVHHRDRKGLTHWGHPSTGIEESQANRRLRGAQANDTARIPLAPKLAFESVPSRSIMI